jgi:hypothetical protein
MRIRGRRPRCERHFPSFPSTRCPPAGGPFAFAAPEPRALILAHAGFGSVTVNPFDAGIGGGDFEQTVKMALEIGP